MPAAPGLACAGRRDTGQELNRIGFMISSRTGKPFAPKGPSTRGTYGALHRDEAVVGARPRGERVDFGSAARHVSCEEH